MDKSEKQHLEEDRNLDQHHKEKEADMETLEDLDVACVVVVVEMMLESVLLHRKADYSMSDLQQHQQLHDEWHSSDSEVFN